MVFILLRSSYLFVFLTKQSNESTENSSLINSCVTGVRMHCQSALSAVTWLMCAVVRGKAGRRSVFSLHLTKALA